MAIGILRKVIQNTPFNNDVKWHHLKGNNVGRKKNVIVLIDLRA